MTLDAVMMRSAAAVMMDAAAVMMDIGTRAGRARTARRPTVIKERDAAVMDAGIPHVEEITSVTHQDHHHHLLRPVVVEVEAEEAEDSLKVSVWEGMTMKLVLASPRLRKIPRHSTSTPPWPHLSPRSSTTKITTSVLSVSVLESMQWSTP